jgi:hypothetical protein
MVTIVKADTSSLSIVMYIGRALARYEYTSMVFSVFRVQTLPRCRLASSVCFYWLSIFRQG